MYHGKIVFSQLISYLPKYEFNKCVMRYRGNHKIKTFSCWDQFLCMAFATKHELSSIPLFFGMETVYLLFQFGLFGLALGLIHGWSSIPTRANEYNVRISSGS
jgi:hypothetical protein